MTSFPLAGLLRLRRLEENQAAATLSRAHARRRELARRADAMMIDLTDTTQAPVGRSTLLALAAARASASALLGELRTEQEVAAAALATAQEEHRAARATTTTIEKLKERHDQQVAAEELRQEQVGLDETAARAWAADREGRP